jgi:hypothetical protein
VTDILETTEKSSTTEESVIQDNELKEILIATFLKEKDKKTRELFLKSIWVPHIEGIVKGYSEIKWDKKKQL